MSVVIIDMDGVLTDFTHGFRTLANRVYGVPVYSQVAQPTYGSQGLGQDRDLTQEHIGHLWELIKRDPTFWFELPPIENPRILIEVGLLCLREEVYFVTTRPGVLAKQQTERWLGIYCNIQYPSVIITSDKGAIAKAVRADWFLDDLPDNVHDVELHSPNTVACLRDRIYNQNGHVGPRRIYALADFLEAVNRDETFTRGEDGKRR